MRYRLLLVVWAALGVAGTITGQSVDEIKQAWQKRQDPIKTLRVSWSEVNTLPKGLIDQALPNANPKAPNPPTDLRLPGRGMVSFDEQSLRAELTRSRWSVPHRKVMETEETNVFKEGKNTALLTKSTVVTHPSATIERRKKPADIMEYTFWPVTCFARGLSPTFAPFDLNDYELTGKRPTVAGRKCVELAHKTRTTNTTHFLELDAERGFLLLRYFTLTNERMTLRLDITYSPDPALGWVPKSWDYAATSETGMPIGSRQVTRADWETNPELGADTFVNPLPPGTLVHDSTGGDAVQYVVRDDGRSGPPVLDADRPNYDQLTDLARSAARRERWWLITGVVAGALALIALAFTLSKRWRRQDIRRPPDLPPVSNSFGGPA